MVKRSLKCQDGKHDINERGLTITIDGRCAGYAGTVPCECTCHEKKEK